MPVAYVTGGDIVYLLIGLGVGSVAIFLVAARLLGWYPYGQGPRAAAKSADMRIVAAMVVAAGALLFLPWGGGYLPWYLLYSAALIAYGFFIEGLKKKARRKRPPA